MLVLFNGVLLFPLLFMGRVISPNDIFYNYDPWRSVQNVEAQNPIVNDPPASYLTLVSLLKEDAGAFHWNRYIASGVPGFGSVASAVLSPFVLLAALLPLSLFYTAFILLKLNSGYCAAYVWLRHERLGRAGAAIGAMVFAGAGTYAVWWLWQATNGTTLYPCVLILVVRLMERRSISFFKTALLALAFLLSGFPAVVVYAAYITLAYFVFTALRRRSWPSWSSLGKVVAAALLALVVAAPLLAPFIRFLGETGYLEARSNASLLSVYPTSHLRLLIDPFFLGDPVAHRWLRNGAIQVSDNLVETTLYLGLLTLPLVALGLFGRRLRAKWFWFVLLAALFLLMFATTPLSTLVGKLPGLHYSPLTRLRVLLPLAAAALAANGVAVLLRIFRSKPKLLRALPLLCALAIAYDLSFFAARFYPYLPPAVAEVPVTDSIRFLRTQPMPFRVLPTFDDFWPNSSELFRIEDIRSHFSSEARYRRMLQRVDPDVWGGSGTVLVFNSLKTRFDDPFLSLLNTKYVLEQPSIDILRWKVELPPDSWDRPTRIGTAEATVEVGVEAPEVRALSLAVQVEKSMNARVRWRVERPETNAIIGDGETAFEQLQRWGHIYLPLREVARRDEHLLVTFETSAGWLKAPSSPTSPLHVVEVTSPLVPLLELNDGRVFLNTRAMPRYHAVWDVRSETFEAWLRDADFDPKRTVMLESEVPDILRGLAAVPVSARKVAFRVRSYSSSRQEVEVESAAPFAFVAAEKLTPELTLTIDGREARPLRANGLFFVVRVEGGRHNLVLQRKIGREWWPWSTAAALLIGLGGIIERVKRGRS